MTNKHSDKAKGAATRKARPPAIAASGKDTAPTTAGQDIAAKTPETTKHAGQRAMGASSMAAEQNPTASGPSPIASPNQEPRRTKSALLRAMVSSAEGASLAGLIAATGWQAHTIRAALTGLRKTGMVVERVRVGDETIYRCPGSAQPAGSTAAAPGSPGNAEAGALSGSSWDDRAAEAVASSPAAVLAP